MPRAAHLLALFVQVLGLYLPGSLLELNDGRWVVSVSGGRGPERFSWLIVRVVREADSRPCDGREEIDLHAVRPSLRPRRVLNPASQGLDLSELLRDAGGGL